MTKPRVLLLGIYPIDPAQHGGQRRVRAIAECYQRGEWEVKHIAAYPCGWYRANGHRAEHIEFPRKFTRYLTRNGLRADVHACRYFEQHASDRQRLIRSVESFQPDVIQFEHPWLFPVLEDYIRVNRDRFRVAYSSHNIECELLSEILRAADHSRVDAFVAATRAMEQALVATADVTICVTEEDADMVRSWSPQDVLVARNGAARRPRPTCSKWQRRLAGCPYAFVTGSGHPPNGLGFVEVLGADFAFARPDARVVIAGGMVGTIHNSRAYQVRRTMAAARTVCVGDPSEEDLDYLLNHASVIILPITQGGGSNIKTAEALLSDRPIIGTSTAFRGFEMFKDAPGVTVEDNPSDFRQSVRDALRVSGHDMSNPRDAEGLLWENTLSGIPIQMADLARHHRLVAA